MGVGSVLLRASWPTSVAEPVRSQFTDIVSKYRERKTPDIDYWSLHAQAQTSALVCAYTHTLMFVQHTNRERKRERGEGGRICLELDMVAQVLSLALGKLKQDHHHKFKASLGYILRSSQTHTHTVDQACNPST